MPETHRLAAGKSIRISKLSTCGKDFHDSRKQAEAEFAELQRELIDLQHRFYADDKHSLLIVLQAMDAGGKDSTIRSVFSGVNPQGVRVTSYKQPSTLERAHDFLWRIHQAAPARGMIGVFNRSHYEDVLVVRVENLVPPEVWQPRYEHINAFERLLTSSSTTVLKFFLHISKAEQKERFQKRLDHPEKHWKFSRMDVEKRKDWDRYMEAYEDALNQCTTDAAPWHVIPSDQKWYRNLAIGRVIVDTLKQIDPKFPPPDEDFADFVLE